MEFTLLFLTSIAAGVLNAVAGGGTFLIFPILLFTGMNPITANATATFPTWCGTIASAIAYKDELKVNSNRLPMLVFVSLIGSAIGAIALLKTPVMTFSWLIPYLMLFATLILALGRNIIKKLHEWKFYLGPVGSFVLQLAIAAYGGYFGAGMGIMILAMLLLIGLEHIHEMNAIRTVLGISINGIAVFIFIKAGIIAWPQALIMLVGTILGGYYGAVYAKKLPDDIVHNFVIVVGAVMTLYFFIKG